MTTAHAVSPSHSGRVEETSARDARRRLLRVAWLQHRGACLALLVVFVVFVIAIILERTRIDGSYSTFVADGCVARQLSFGTCNSDALALGGGVNLQTIGTALSALPVLVGVFLGAPLVAREVESGTFRFAWTQSTNRTRLLFTSLAMLGFAVAAMAAVLGLLFGGWYTHVYEVVLSPVYSDWQSRFFATTWWMLAVWALMALALGTFIGTLIRRTVQLWRPRLGHLSHSLWGAGCFSPNYSSWALT